MRKRRSTSVFRRKYLNITQCSFLRGFYVACNDEHTALLPSPPSALLVMSCWFLFIVKQRIGGLSVSWRDELEKRRIMFSLRITVVVLILTCILRNTAMTSIALLIVPFSSPPALEWGLIDWCIVVVWQWIGRLFRCSFSEGLKEWWIKRASRLASLQARILHKTSSRAFILSWSSILWVLVPHSKEIGWLVVIKTMSSALLHSNFKREDEIGSKSSSCLQATHCWIRDFLTQTFRASFSCAAIGCCQLHRFLRFLLSTRNVGRECRGGHSVCSREITQGLVVIYNVERNAGWAVSFRPVFFFFRKKTSLAQDALGNHFSRAF